MATRTLSNVKGDIGEMEVIIMLLRLGMNINSLTQSDTGWDIHAQLPLTPMTGADEHHEPWELSGRTCHIQVKNQEKPLLTLGTVRGWVSAAAVGGPPTFIFVKRQDEWHVGTTRDLEEWVEQFNNEPPANKVGAFIKERDIPDAPELGLVNRDRKSRRKESGTKQRSEPRVSRPVEPLKVSRKRDLELSGLLHLWTFYPAMSMRSAFASFEPLVG